MADFSYWVIVDTVEVEPPKANAYLFIVDGKKIWVPASTVMDVRADEHTGETFALKIEQWMIKKKGLEQYMEGD